MFRIFKKYIKTSSSVQSLNGSFQRLCTSAFALTLMAGCSINPATGERQFTALMSPQQELQVGASEHQKIISQFGVYDDKLLKNYVDQIGQRIAKDTERKDLVYTFTVLDTPIVNAFALPGGYVYVSRGLMALANNEAELAAVLAHEVGHITARHSAERYSTSVVTSLGTNVLAAAIGQAGVSQALGVGNNLYLKSYSREQEDEADSLGIRYLERASYSPQAMSSFLQHLQGYSELEDRLKGRQSSGFNYFSTHPATEDRVRKTRLEAQAYAQHDVWLRDKYLKKIDGIASAPRPASD